MRVARLHKRDYRALSGEGAAKWGGRWNSRGKEVVYTASCPALAVLELRALATTMPKHYVLSWIELPDLESETVVFVPSDLKAFVQIGDEWLEHGRTAILRVPSVLVPRQLNYLINPLHRAFGQIQVVEETPFAFDWRLLSAALQECGTNKLLPKERGYFIATP